MLRLQPPGHRHGLFPPVHDTIHSAAACRMEESERRMKFENEWNRMARIMNETDMLLHPTKSNMNTDKDNFKVLLEVTQFKPEEITVSANNNSVFVEGNHEERINQNEYKSRHFTGSYSLPSDVIGSEVECNLSSEGKLEIFAPRHILALTQGKISEKISPPHPNTSPTIEIGKGKPTPPVTPMKHERTPRRHVVMRTEEEVKLFGEWNFIGNKGGYNRHPNLRDQERLESLFNEIHDFEGFKDVDMMPIWRRRDWAGGPCRPARQILESQENTKLGEEDVEDWPDFKPSFDLEAPRREMDGKIAVSAEEFPIHRNKNVQFQPNTEKDEKKEEKHNPLTWVKHHFLHDAKREAMEERPSVLPRWNRESDSTSPPTPMRSTNPVAAQLAH